MSLHAPRAAGRRSHPSAWFLLTACCLLTGLFTALLAVAAPGDASAAPSVASRFEPVDPNRVLDTRAGAGKVRAGTTVAVPLSAVPANATAVVLNVTVTDPDSAGYITAFSGSTMPATSNANVDEAGKTAANLVVVATGGVVDVKVFASMNTHLIVDLSGWFVPPAASSAGRYRSVEPATSRILDTRAESTAAPSTSNERRLPINGRAGVPATGVQAVALNVTITDTATAGWLQVIPTAGTTVAGGSSNVNITNRNQTVANLVIVPVGDDGSVTLVGTVTGHVIVDVAGWFTTNTAAAGTDGLFVAIDPARLADSRKPAATTPLLPGTTLTVSTTVSGVDPAQIGSAFANLTITETRGAGYVTGYPGLGDLPQASSINADKAHATVANAGIIATNGTSFGLYTSQSAHLIVDLLGWFTRTASSLPPGLDPIGIGSVVSSTPSAGGQLIRYRSISAAGHLQEQITLAFRPAGSPPAGGWPVMALVHGPWGLGDACAVSVISQIPPEATPWLNAGYVVVFPNLEGLGEPGPHPYLNGPGTGRSVLDAVRAARRVYGSGVSNRVGSWGFSSGAHGAMWAAEMAPTYAPELDMRGVISLDPVTVVSSYLDGVWQEGGFNVWITLGATVTNPNLQYAEVMKPETIARLPLLESRCMDGTVNDVYGVFDDIAGGPMHTNPMSIPAWAATIRQADLGHRRSAPVWLAGGNDFTSDIPAIEHSLHQEYINQACDAGTSVRFRIFNGDHLYLNTAPVLAESITWLNGQMNGPAQTGCTTVNP